MLRADLLEEELARASANAELPPPALRRLLRKRAGLTQAALARACGVHRAALCRWESGERTPRDVRTYLAALKRLREARLA
jgi:transcriptional regulator with XRE-family HTH domain